CIGSPCTTVQPVPNLSRAASGRRVRSTTSSPRSRNFQRSRPPTSPVPPVRNTRMGEPSGTRRRAGAPLAAKRWGRPKESLRRKRRLPLVVGLLLVSSPWLLLDAHRVERGLGGGHARGAGDRLAVAGEHQPAEDLLGARELDREIDGVGRRAD